MNILLLGATGYLGSNIAYKLSQENHDLICSVRRTSDTARLEPLNATFISNEPGEIELTLKHARIDWIINGVCTYKENETLYEDMLDSNVVFPLKVLNLAIKYNVKNYMTMGTSLPDELTSYSFTKHRFSEFGKYLSAGNGINFADLQLEMFYGGLFEPENRFLKQCRKTLLEDKDLALTEGYQKRDIVRVEDIVMIIAKLIQSDYVKGYQILPIGSGENHSIREIVSFMKHELGSKSGLHYGVIPDRINEPDTLSDISWYKEIDYTLQYTYFEGLKEICGKEKGN